MIVPIYRKDEQRAAIMERLARLTPGFDGIGFKIDDREQHSPGFKFNHWEQRGVPLRMEMGPKDLEKNQVVLVRRDNGEKRFVSQDGLADTIAGSLDEIQSGIFQRALDFRESNTHRVDDYSHFNPILDGENAGVSKESLVRFNRLRGENQGGNQGDHPLHSPRPGARWRFFGRQLHCVRPSIGTAGDFCPFILTQTAVV